MTKGFYTVLLAQFLSSLADNALLIAAIALLTAKVDPAWMTPLLKVFFVSGYVIFAAWVGPFADSMPKGQVMVWTNLLKALGVILMLFGTHPLFCYGLVGLGAAAYSPAKYGILTELLPADELVEGNGWMEGLTVASIVIGTAFGGFLVSTTVGRIAAEMDIWHLDTAVQLALGVLCMIYCLAAIVSLWIPRTGAKLIKLTFRPKKTILNFVYDWHTLMKDHLGGTSMMCTSVFWGTVYALQFLVIKWGAEGMGLPLSEAAVLQGVVAVGVAIGSVLAAIYVSLKDSPRVIPCGIMMGIMVAAMAAYKSSWIPGGFYFLGVHFSFAVMFACLMLTILGVFAGLFIVPMDAILQHRGSLLMTAGKSIAVQNFNENSATLLMLAGYSVLIYLGFSTVTIMVIFGIFLAVCTASVWRSQRKWINEIDTTTGSELSKEDTDKLKTKASAPATPTSAPSTSAATSADGAKAQSSKA